MMISICSVTRSIVVEHGGFGTGYTTVIVPREGYSADQRNVFFEKPYLLKFFQFTIELFSYAISS